jgi:hypothetical protein
MEFESQVKQTELFEDELEIVRKEESPLLAFGKDELNLAEFPLTALSNRVDPGQKTLEFKDQIFDKKSGQLIERQLTITAADKYGLPTAKDDEVILALIQLSKRQGFNSRVVTFSRYEIARVLGWKDEGWAYQRIEESLNRWLGVTLMYQNAWRNRETGEWMTEGFHILERISKVTEAGGSKRDAFTWSDIIFQSFQQGNLKNLDLQMWRQLSSPVAKRLYRLLDKRFHHRKKQQFDLVELAMHKLGLSKNYLIAGLKNRLDPAIAELEDIGYIKRATKKERYLKVTKGEWQVVFEQASSKDVMALPLHDQVTLPLHQALVELGVSPKKAQSLVGKYPEEFLTHKIDQLRFHMAHKGADFKNPAGFLVKSIEEDYAPPSGYKTPEQREQEEAERNEKRQKREQVKEAAAAKQRERDEAARQAAQQQSAEVQAFLDSMPEEEQCVVITEAIRREMAKGFMGGLKPDSRAYQTLKKQAVEEYVLELIAAD